jgi:membrane protein implicated in regulation of membrane protease activity
VVVDSDPETWRWIWLVAAVGFGVGEIAIAGSFFLAPFALGAALAAILAFAGADIGIQWIAFVGTSGVLLAAMRPLARRLDATGPVLGVGSHRQIGQRARVVEAIDGEHDHGFVMLGAERWRAESIDGVAIAEGSTVTVVEVRGTRVLVAPAADGPPDAPPDAPPDLPASPTA